jgi:hypothetical protein
MMDLLLRLLQGRWIVAALILLTATAFALRRGDAAVEKIGLWLHPPANAYSPLAADLVKDADARESARLRGLHRAVVAELRAARGKGLNVATLQELADSALALDAPGTRATAIERLNTLRVAIPRKKGLSRPASNED